MRTTIALDDRILELARQQALAQQVSLAKYIETAWRAKLTDEAREKPLAYLPLKTFKGKGLLPHIDLNDSVSLLNVMEGKECG